MQEDEWLQGDLAHTSHHTQAGLRRKTFIIMEINQVTDTTVTRSVSRRKRESGM